MALGETRIEESVGAVVAAAVSGTEDLLVVNPGERAVGAVVEEVEDGAGGRVRLLSAPGPLEARTREFRAAARVADLVADDRLAARTVDPVPRNTLLLTAESAAVLVPGSGGAAGLAVPDGGFAAGLYDRFDRQWANAAPFGLRTPPLSRVRTTLREEVGEGTGGDFDRLLDSLDPGAVDEVAVSLLAGARNGALFYDLSRWGEDVGLASKATFSRTKGRLEEAGLLDTEKVPIDVGRPRLRLRLPEDLAEASVGALAGAATDRL